MSIFRPSADKTITTQLAKALAENIKLKQDLERATSLEAARKVQAEHDREVATSRSVGNQVAQDYEPSMGGIKAEPPITAKGSAGDIKRLMEQGADRQRIDERAKRFVELDKKALESQRTYFNNNGIMSVKANSVILPTGCDSERMQTAIGVENTSRITNHQTPYLTYNEWLTADKVQAQHNHNTSPLTIRARLALNE